MYNTSAQLDCTKEYTKYVTKLEWQKVEANLYATVEAT